MAGLRQIILCFLLGFATLAGVALAPAQAASSRVPQPDPGAVFKGSQCVAPVEVIRREHMNYLKHTRDETVRGGIRGAKFSLRQCIDCHAVPDKKAGGKRTVRTFCSACHNYAAVKIDCFECHTNEAETAALKGYLHNKTAAAPHASARFHTDMSLIADIEKYLGERKSDDVRQTR
jgi:hypothetical protein